MDRLLAIEGGQQLQAKDWDFIQDVAQDTLRSLVKGLAGISGPVIIQGLVAVIGDGDINISEGYLFRDDEIFYVPGATFTDNGELWSLHLTPNTTTGESRVFKDTTTHNVYEYRRYLIGYATAVPEGSIGFPGTNLLGLISSHVLGQVPAAPAQLLKYFNTTVAASSLNNAQIIVPAQGAGKVVKVVSLQAWISPTTQLNVGVQDLLVFYLNDEGSASIGSFPNGFIESATAKMHDMVPSPSEMFANKSVQVQLSAGVAPSSGSASIKFHCCYIVITI